MAITSTELVPHYATGRDKTNPAANGGRPSTTAIGSSVEGNVWPSLTTAQLAAGQTIAEKICIKNRNAADAVGSGPWLTLSVPNSSDDIEWLVPADQDQYQGDLTGSERRYSAARLATDADAGAISIVLELDAAETADCWQDGDSIIIYSNKTGPAATPDTNEHRSISGAPVLAGNQLTITLNSGLSKAHSKANSATCCSLYKPAQAWKPWVANTSQSGTGSYDLASYPIELGNLGAVRQRWTLTYTSTTQAELSGDTLGSLGVFPINADIAPINQASGTPYLTIKAGGHGAAHVAGDKLEFDSYEAAICCFWFKKTPAGAAAMPLTVSRLAAGCETVS